MQWRLVSLQPQASQPKAPYQRLRINESERIYKVTDCDLVTCFNDTVSHKLGGGAQFERGRLSASNSRSCAVDHMVSVKLDARRHMVTLHA